MKKNRKLLLGLAVVGGAFLLWKLFSKKPIPVNVGDDEEKFWAKIPAAKPYVDTGFRFFDSNTWKR